MLAAADALDADVIVTGTRSLHGVREVISNTLSHALIQHSPRPVLAIPTPVDAPTDRPRRLQARVHAVDLDRVGVLVAGLVRARTTK